jgi:quercetin dioxygenase-like cupin family protein
MPQPTISTDEMQARIVRFPEVRERGIPLMFIDSILPRHHRMNFAIVGDTASENPEFQPILAQPHKFQIGMVNAPPGCGPAYHTHDYIELFFVLTGRWRYYWGNDPAGVPEGEAFLDPWDMISLPAGLYRGFENVSAEPAWLLAVLEPHEVFAGKDPYWAPAVPQQAAQFGFHSDERGQMVKPDNYDELRRQFEAQLLPGVLGVSVPASAPVRE